MKSIITKYDWLDIITGQPAECQHHAIFGQGLRHMADEDKLLIPLTHAHHNASPDGLTNQIHDNIMAERLSKMLGQMAWEKEYYRSRMIDTPLWDPGSDPAREAFVARYGMGYM